MSSQHGGRPMKLLALCVRVSWGKIFAGLLFAALASGAMLTVPWTLKLAIDDVFPKGDVRLLAGFLGVVTLIYLLKNAFVLAGRRIMLSAGEKTAFTLRQMFFSHLQTLSVGYHKTHKPGESITRIMGDVSQVEGFIQTGVPKTLNTLVMLGGVLVIIFLRDPILATVALLVLPMHLLLYLGFKNKIKSSSRNMRDRESGLTTGLVEALLGAEVMAASAAEASERERFYSRAQNLLESRLKLGSLQLWQKVLADAVVGLGTVGFIYYGGRIVMKGTMEVGEFTAFLFYVKMMYPLSLALIQQMSHTIGTVASAERLMDTLDIQSEISEARSPVTLPNVNGALTFEDVAFSYNGTTGGFSGFNLKVQPGEIVAVTGPVGSGKSTLGYLIARFYDTTHGRIYLDNVNLTQLSLDQLRRTVGIAFQEPYLFTGTIAENIGYSRPDAGISEIEAVADMVGLRDLLDSLPDGLHTMIGEGGIQLSLGQKHLIDLARALMKEPRVLILDSILTEGDSSHRWAVERMFRRITAGRTVLVINPPSFILEYATRVVELSGNGSVRLETREESVV